MIHAYIRVSTEKQNTENQKFEISNFATDKGFGIDKWTVETISSKKQLEDRKLYKLLGRLHNGDIVICTELSRFGRSLYEVMSILNILMQKKITVYTTKEGYELGDNINSQVLAFAFSLSAQIERTMISQRTKEALYRKKKEGVKLGRPKGSISCSMLDGKEKIIIKWLNKDVSVSSIAKKLRCNRGTLDKFIRSRGLKK